MGGGWGRPKANLLFLGLGGLSSASGAEHEAWPVGRVGLEGLVTVGVPSWAWGQKAPGGVCPTQPGESVTPYQAVSPLGNWGRCSSHLMGG